MHRTRLRDTFEIDTSGESSGDPLLWLRFNGPAATIFVWENNLNMRVNRRVRLDAGLSYIDARFDEPIDRVPGLATREFLKRPDWTGHFGVSTTGASLLDTHTYLRYTGPMLAVGEEAGIWRDTPHFFVLDLGVSKSFKLLDSGGKLIVSIGVDNAFDQRQKDLQDNGEARDPTYLYGPTQPRTWYRGARMFW
jgi:outer membrane receptor for ferrienterochelin and colicins